MFALENVHLVNSVRHTTLYSIRFSVGSIQRQSRAGQRLSGEDSNCVGLNGLLAYQQIPAEH